MSATDTGHAVPTDSEGQPASWSVAIFAHNEAAHIAAAIERVLAEGPAQSLAVVVLANGCTDRTVAIAQQLAAHHANLQVVDIALADKANAWNHYVHQVCAQAPHAQAAMHVFVDGDVTIQAGSLAALTAAFAHYPNVNAAGALPCNGRDRAAWTRRMLANGTLADGLYALSGRFVERLRQRAIGIPRGLIGEHWAVSLYAQSDLQPLLRTPPDAAHVAFAQTVGFAFRSLSPWRPGDYRIYLRRLWRYALRGVQFEMLAGWLLHHAPEHLPAHVDELYRLGLPPSRLKWVGPTSPLRSLAVQWVRRRRAGAAS